MTESLSRLLAEFDATRRPAGKDSFTIAELAEKMGCGKMTAGRWLKERLEDGRVELDGFRKKTGITGVIKPVQAYRVVESSGRKVKKPARR